MFGIKHNECVGFESKWKVKKVSSESSTQTTEFAVNERGTSTQEKISTEVQTVVDDTGSNNSTSEADMEKLAVWLSNIYPRMKKEIDDANNSRAFRGYRLINDRRDANCKLLQHINVFKCDGTGDKVTKVSAITWNQTGKTFAVTCSYEHTSWCYHLGEVLIYTLNRDEKVPDLPRTKLSSESCVMTLKFHPTHPAIIAAGTFAGGIIIWNIQNDERNDVIATVTAHEESVTHLSWITDLDSKSILLATSSTDGLLKLWTFNTANANLIIRTRYKIKPPILGSVRRNTETPEHLETKASRGVICFDFSKHVRDLFVVGIEGGIVVQCSLLGATELKGNTKEEPLLDPAFKYYEPHGGEVTSVSISPNRNDMFMTCGTDAEIRIYLFGQEEPAQVIFMRDPLSDLTFVPHEEKLVVGCGSKGILQIFHLISGRGIEDVTKEKVPKQVLSSLAINCNKTNLVAIGTVQGDLQLWNVPWQSFSRIVQ